ncbi:MAG: shikimate dehydrogenase [Gammaproteobacteria bacterium]|nr:shikimate dehydrogenase [Gammaproteobacteria bacterium]
MVQFNLKPGIDHYCVMGNPVAHSKSPRIHQAFASQTGQSLDYQAVLVPENEFAETLEAFRQQGGKGVNVTLPFKESAWEAATARTERAGRAGAVNTIWFEDSMVHGDNTDGIGLIRDLRDNLDCPLQGRDILILGAGGAVRGIIDPLFDAGVASIALANRTVVRAQRLAEKFADRGAIHAVSYPALTGSYAVIINGTSLSLQNEVPPLPDGVLAAGGIAYDMMYQPTATCFMRWAAEREGGMTADGLGMLVEQAAESFCIWRGVRPETAPVIAELRA